MRSGLYVFGVGLLALVLFWSASAQLTQIPPGSSTATPIGPAGGDLSGTYPNPTVARVNGATYPATPLTTNTVPVVTGSGAITYEQVPNAALANASISVNSTTCTLGGSCSPGAAPTGAAGGDLGNTYPNPTVFKTNGVSYPPGPSTNTVPVVTGANTVTYEAVPNAALANSTITINTVLCTLGLSCTVGSAPTGTAGGDLSGTYPNPTVAKVNGVSYGTGPSTNTVAVVTGANTTTYEQVPVAALVSSSTTVNGTSCALGGSCTVTAGSNLKTVNITADSATVTTSETSIVSTTFGSNTLGVGSQFRITGGGQYSTGVTPGVLTLRIRVGPTTLTGNQAWSIAFNLTASQSNQSFWMDTLLTVQTTGSGGTVLGGGVLTTNVTGVGIVTAKQLLTAGNVAVNTTVSNLIEVTVVTSQAGSSIAFSQLSIHQLL